MRTLFGIMLTLLPLWAYTQVISGVVLSPQKEPLPGASVYWAGVPDSGVFTDQEGKFKISAKQISQFQLVASYVGRKPDTVRIGSQTYVEFRLEDAQILEQVLITGTKPGIILSNLKTVKTEQITQTELRKAACCDLAGCFETQLSVQPQTTNVITNSKELRILGLSGVYNQVLIDGMPMIQGLSYTYGISSIPGVLVDNIYVAKGANSVLQGFESISGQINVETKDPGQTDRALLNAYINSFAEKHFNALFAFQKGKWGNLSAVHTVQPAQRTDRDEDRFLDLPLLTRYMAFSKWTYGREEHWGWSSETGLRFLNERRVGGQLDFDPASDQGSNRIYGQTVRLQQPELWTKTAYRLDDKHRIALIASAFHQNQDSWFGVARYQARQNSAYANIQYEFVHGPHDLKMGLSMRYLQLEETIGFQNDPLERTYAGQYRRMERIPGVFAEHTMRFFDNRLTWLAGIRGDRHNQFGNRLTPRMLLKYDASPNTTIRANIGSGWRTVNLFSENINLLASSRNVIFTETLQPESALNMGLNFTHKFSSQTVSGYFSADFYQTRFQNQIFPDYDSDPTSAIVQNFNGLSVSNGFMAEGAVSFNGRLDFKAGYNFLEVFRQEGERRNLLPFNPRHKVMSAMSYKAGKLQADLNAHWYGRQRLPNTEANPAQYRRPEFSAPYAIVNVQLTYLFGALELYGGCENISNFRQLQPILGWQDPFGPYFDTSAVWGPTRGREWYLGFRWRFERKAPNS